MWVQIEFKVICCYLPPPGLNILVNLKYWWTFQIISNFSHWFFIFCFCKMWKIWYQKAVFQKKYRSRHHQRVLNLYKVILQHPPAQYFLYTKEAHKNIGLDIPCLMTCHAAGPYSCSLLTKSQLHVLLIHFWDTFFIVIKVEQWFWPGLEFTAHGVQNNLGYCEVNGNGIRPPTVSNWW